MLDGLREDWHGLDRLSAAGAVSTARRRRRVPRSWIGPILMIAAGAGLFVGAVLALVRLELG